MHYFNWLNKIGFVLLWEILIFHPERFYIYRKTYMELVQASVAVVAPCPVDIGVWP